MAHYITLENLSEFGPWLYEGRAEGVLLGAAILFFAAMAWAEEPVYPKTGSVEEGFSWREEIAGKIPPLEHDRGERWPMILWDSVGFEPLSAEVHQALLARGIVQHIRMETKMIATAKALQEAGAPVVMVQGASGTWRYQMGGAESEWAHQFEAGYTPESKRLHACPHRFAGYAVRADTVRQILGTFKEAGVVVDAVWMDWEDDPYVPSTKGDLYEQARHCQRCRAELPPAVLEDEERFLDYCWRLYQELNGAYLAGPVLEVFPRCSVTNWMILYSTPERTARHWNDRTLAPFIPPVFNATNPVAYGNDKFWRAAWKDGFPLNREHVDQFYMHLMLRMVSDDAANRQRYRPETKSFPWVVRWCPDINDPKIPMMSREAYRESLRHMWLRGVDGMQIFQPRRPDYHHISVGEVYDAVAVYDEMLAYREFLDHGEILSTDVPALQDGGVVWSGLRLEDRAVVRAYAQSKGRAVFEIQPWPSTRVELVATDQGRTYLLERVGNEVEVEDLGR